MKIVSTMADPERRARPRRWLPLPDLPPRDILDTAGDLLRALAAPVRIAIVLELRESARCVHELVDALAVPQPLVSQHLRILKSAGVVAGERSGREVMYRLVDDHLADIVVAAVSPRRRGQASEHAPGPCDRTRQRAAISALLENLDDFRSAQELHDELRRRGEGIGLTTVYRTLQSMAANGLVDTLRTDTGESVYRRCSETTTTIWSAGRAARRSRSRAVRRGVGRRGGPRARLLRRQPHHRDLRHLRRLHGRQAGHVPGTAMRSRRMSAPVASTMRISVRSASSVRPAAGKL